MLARAMRTQACWWLYTFRRQNNIFHSLAPTAGCRRATVGCCTTRPSSVTCGIAELPKLQHGDTNRAVRCLCVIVHKLRLRGVHSMDLTLQTKHVRSKSCRGEVCACQACALARLCVVVVLLCLQSTHLVTWARIPGQPVICSTFREFHVYGTCRNHHCDIVHIRCIEERSSDPSSVVMSPAW